MKLRQGDKGALQRGMMRDLNCQRNSQMDRGTWRPDGGQVVELWDEARIGCGMEVSNLDGFILFKV